MTPTIPAVLPATWQLPAGLVSIVGAVLLVVWVYLRHAARNRAVRGP